MGMATKETASQLESAIRVGEFTRVRNLIDTITDVEIIRTIESKFPDRDPLILAIECREQQIAQYLVEKGFNHRLCYVWPGQKCDHWCLSEHGDDPCPTEYDALEFAYSKDLLKVAKVISDIRAGLRMPGDGLALMQHPAIKREDSSISNKRIRSSTANDSNTVCQQARRRLKEIGLNLLTQTGETAIHSCTTPAMVHVAAVLRVNINAVNFDGDSALHKAVKQHNRDLVQALLMQGADPTQKNKLGQSALSLSSPYIRTVIEPFKCGLGPALQRGESGTVMRLIQLWINPFSVITRDGRTGMELAKSKAKESQGFSKCYSTLQNASKTLDVIHSVLSEDLPNLKRLLRTETGWTLNKRFKDRLGETLVSCAIEQNNLEIVQILVETQQCNLNLRVREQAEGDVTVPLLFKTLSEQCRDEIWSFIDYHVDCYQSSEKDSFGNTAILRAITCSRSASFIQRFLRRDQNCIFERNSSGQNAREMALSLDRKDIVEIIDNFVVNKGNSCFVLDLPVNFYGQENLNIYNQEGKSLISVAQACTSSWSDDVMRVIQDYPHAEAIGTRLHKASAQGKLRRIAKLNNANYKDQNGYTALIRAIVYQQLEAAEILITERPVLKQIPDNSNRYPLHYAYSLPEDQSTHFVRLLLQRNPEDIETKLDCKGREAAEYKDLRDTDDVTMMLHDARTLDTHGKRTSGLGLLPQGAVDHQQALQQSSIKLGADNQSSTGSS